MKGGRGQRRRTRKRLSDAGKMGRIGLSGVSMLPFSNLY